MNLSDNYMTSLSLWGTIFAALFSVLCLGQIYKTSSRKRFPSPPGAFLVGHLRVLTEGFPWLTLCDWSEKYGKATLLWNLRLLTPLIRSLGDILQLFVARKSIIVLNKAQDAHTLLEKRGAIYSDRPETILQGEMLVNP